MGEKVNLEKPIPTVTVGSLAEIDLNHIAAVAADIDYTLIDFGPAHAAGIDALKGVYGSDFAAQVGDLFHLILEGHRRPHSEEWSERAKFTELIDEMARMQLLSSVYGVKVWSREAWIQIVARDMYMTLQPEDVIRGRDAYWAAVSRSSELYPDARDFGERLVRDKIPLFLFTGSDSVLKPVSGGMLEYDPVFSEDYKRRRLAEFPLSHRGLIIGDPIDKPHPDYFERLAALVEHSRGANKSQIIMLGDSPRNDLEVPQRMGYRTVHIKR